MSKFKEEFSSPVLFHNDHGPFYVMDAVHGVDAMRAAMIKEIGREPAADEISDGLCVSFGFGRECDGYHPHENGPRWQIQDGGRYPVLCYYGDTHP